MVPSSFVYLMYALIACACALLIFDEAMRLLMWFGQLQMQPSLQQHLQKIVALELLSFVSLFGIGIGLLEYHRFGAAIFVFSLGCAVLAVSLLLAAFGIGSRLLKWIVVPLIVLLAVEACEYLMDIVQQGEGEYDAAVIAKAVEIPTSTRWQRRSKEHDKEIIEQHETKDSVSVGTTNSKRRPLGDPKATQGPEVFGEFVCDLSFLFVNVPQGEIKRILILPNNLEPYLLGLNGPIGWPESENVDKPLMDQGLDCEIVNSSKEQFLNSQGDLIVEFDSANPRALVKKAILTVYIPSLEAGQSYAFHVINQSRFNATVKPPSMWMIYRLGSMRPTEIPLRKRIRSPADAWDVLFPSKYLWQGEKIIRMADKPN